MGSITINGINIDTSAPKTTLAAFSLDNDDASSSDYVLVKLRTPINQGQRNTLEGTGAEILEAVPEQALLCHFPGTNLAALRALPFVEWADIYPEQVKLSPTLRKLTPKPGGISIAAATLAPAPALDPTPVTVDVQLHRNVDMRTAATQIAEAAHLDESELSPSAGKVRLTLKRRRLADVTALDIVRSIDEVHAQRLANDVARTILGLPDKPADATHAYDGANEIVAVADTGFDKGSTTQPHPAFEGRVKALYAIGRASLTDDPHGHGTHVAGSVLADGVIGTGGRLRGTAPGASLILQSLLTPAGGLKLPSDLNTLFDKPYKDGARIHTNSWGSTGDFGVYESQAKEVDEFVYQHRDMLICFAAGNSGADRNTDGVIDSGSVTPPGTAKNCLTVGACENNRPEFTLTYGAAFSEFASSPRIKSDTMASNPDGMVAFSSRGPTNDLRIKPDVVAPGTYVLSTRSRVTKSKGWALHSDPLYMYDGGTSMATPLVAGCAAALRTFLRKEHKIMAPSAALMKALLINSAQDIKGQYLPSEAGGTPNNSEGHGRVDMGALIATAARAGSLQFHDESRALDTGEQENYTVDITESGRSLKATLVWTDPPGEGLQNDLDLIVHAGTTERHGNMPPGSKKFDRINNVEQVVWKNLPKGKLTISVRAYSISKHLQNYALAIRVI
jgi:subtilisin family serine protease